MGTVGKYISRSRLRADSQCLSLGTGVADFDSLQLQTMRIGQGGRETWRRILQRLCAILEKLCEMLQPHCDPRLCKQK